VNRGLAYHDIHLIHTSLADSGGDELRHFPVTQVHVGIESRRQFNLGQISEAHIVLLLCKVVEGQMLSGQNLRSLHASEIGKQLEMRLTGIGNPGSSWSCWGNSQPHSTEYLYHFDLFSCDYYKCSLRDIGPEGVKQRTM
jgi:hypothetical protein